MARTANFSNLSREDLLLALQDLVQRKRVSPSEIRGAADRARRIASLEQELSKLRTGSGGVVPETHPDGRPKRFVTATPALKAARVWQGRYLGRLRKLGARDKARVKAVAKSDGVPAAVKLADKLLG